MYVLKLPAAEARLEYVRIIALRTNGQAFDWDMAKPRHIWTIERKRPSWSKASSDKVHTHCPVSDAHVQFSGPHRVRFSTDALIPRAELMNNLRSGFGTRSRHRKNIRSDLFAS
jgi:hypothetical protein